MTNKPTKSNKFATSSYYSLCCIRALIEFSLIFKNFLKCVTNEIGIPTAVLLMILTGMDVSKLEWLIIVISVVLSSKRFIKLPLNVIYARTWVPVGGHHSFGTDTVVSIVQPSSNLCQHVTTTKSLGEIGQ